mmetsp:Transcript_92770/g.261969  ORF Transcript_92770/g.261969 Transcript_92770/m.261969 type:complete len:252 (-) Transcript_92770:450-1205(-)
MYQIHAGKTKATSTRPSTMREITGRRARTENPCTTPSSATSNALSQDRPTSNPKPLMMVRTAFSQLRQSMMPTDLLNEVHESLFERRGGDEMNAREVSIREVTIRAFSDRAVSNREFCLILALGGTSWRSKFRSWSAIASRPTMMNIDTDVVINAAITAARFLSESHKRNCHSIIRWMHQQFDMDMKSWIIFNHLAAKPVTCADALKHVVTISSARKTVAMQMSLYTSAWVYCSSSPSMFGSLPTMWKQMH